jgi:hypothetical protein
MKDRYLSFIAWGKVCKSFEEGAQHLGHENNK